VQIIAQTDGWEVVYSHNVESSIDITLLLNRFISYKTTERIDIKNSFLSQFEMVVPVLKEGAPVAFALIGGIKQNPYESLVEIMEFLQTLTNVAAIVIENNRLFKFNLEKELLFKDLSVAADVQNMLIAKNLPNDNLLEMFAYYQPMQVIGGDYYDYIKVSEDIDVFCIADISGKGIPAALLMANFQSTLRILIKQDVTTEQFIHILNKHVFENTNGEKYLTFFIGKYHRKTRELTYINAGHIPPLLIENGVTRKLNVGTTMLGAFEKLPHFNYETITIAPNALLMCYTDGLIEIENENGELFNMQSLKQYMNDNENTSARMLTLKIVAKIKSLKGKKNYGDDICILATRFK
jgi:sigma-B regulation protein RsbU (phosphoserine phosphatase)